MSQKTMWPVARVLSHIKHLKKELDKFVTSKCLLQGVSIGESGDQTFVTGLSRDKLTAELQSNFNQGQSIVDRITKYKQAINKSNTQTFVTINGSSMSVADAIVMKEYLPNKEKFLTVLKKSKVDFNDAHNKLMESFDQRVDAVYGATVDNASSAEEKIKYRTQVVEQQMKLTGPIIMDPNNLDEAIKRLENEISFLKNELDYVLATSNTMVLIEVEV